MLALVLEDGPRLVPDYPEPVPGPAEVLIQVQLAGVCATDLQLLQGYKQFQGVMGHEFVGEVVAARDASWVGRRVVGEINVGCGECTFCAQGIPSQCLSRQAIGIKGLDGVFAERVVLPLKNLHPLPDDLPLQQAVFVEPVAAALQTLTMAHVRPGDKIAVVGDGKLGLLVAQVLGALGAEVTLVGRHPEKLALAASWGLSTSVQDHPHMLDVVVDCTGNPQGFATCLDMVRPRGTLVLKSTYHGLGNVDLTKVVVDEITVVGSRCGPFPPAIAWLRSGRVEVDKLIEKIYPLSQGLEALEHAGQRGALKVLIQP